MTFAVHRSDEADRAPSAARRSAEPWRRGPAHGRRLPPDVRRARRQPRPDTRFPPHEEIDAIARGADVDPHDLRAVNARTEILAGADECSRPAPAACSPRTGTGTRTSAASTVIWIVEHDDQLVRDAHRGRHPRQDRPQRRGPRRLPEHPAHDRGRRRAPARRSTSCCAQVLETTARPSTRRSTLLTQRDGQRLLRRHRRHARATSPTSSCPPAARTSSAARSAPTRTTSSSRRKRGIDVMATESPTTHQRLETVQHRSRCSTRCAPTTATRRASAATSTTRRLGRSDRHGRVRRDEPREAPAARGRRSAVHATSTSRSRCRASSSDRLASTAAR